MRAWIRPALVAGFAGFILCGALACGAIAMIDASKAHDFAMGAAEWLRGIPDAFYDVLSVVGLGYMAARSADKYTQARAGQVVDQDVSS